jgi:hypothetical protein
MAWRFVFAGLRRRPLARAIAVLQEQHNNVLEHDLHIFGRDGRAVIADNRFERGSERARPIGREKSAETYLRRILALTGATQVENGYVLDVGKTRFHVRDRYVRRLQDITDPKSADEGTCFYPVHKGMPRPEEIATMLLQLKNNPALFDRWAAQNGLPFKADGQVFTRAQ